MRVEMQAGAFRASILHGAVGSLTGSRIAGFAAVWEEYSVLTMGTYVDNLFVAARSSMAASLILDDAYLHLR